MIIKLIIEFLLNVLNVFVSVLPSIDVNVDTGALGGLSHFLALANNFISVSVLLGCLTTIITFDGSIFVFRLVKFLWSKIPFFG